MLDAMRSKDGQPVLYLATMMLPYLLYYRADWFDEAKVAPPTTYDEFIAAAKAISAPPNRYGYALRGADYFGTQVIEPIWGSAGIQLERKSVVWGKSVSVRVDLVGRRNIQKQHYKRKSAR